MEKDQGYSTIVSLEPFVHQVGGHSSIQQFDQYTVCKPLFSKELRFYQEVCPLFKPFIPEFKGKIINKYIHLWNLRMLSNSKSVEELMSLVVFVSLARVYEQFEYLIKISLCYSCLITVKCTGGWSDHR